MIGIYRITNNINNKIYIGQSIDIEKRWTYYKSNLKTIYYNSAILQAIKKYGLENFTFEVLEECSVDQLNDREQYYIKLYNSQFDGYNLTAGGDHGRGESNANALLVEEDVKFIRTLYASKTSKTKFSIYNEYFKDKCSYRAFHKVWIGETWKHIMYEVYTQENKDYYTHQAKGKPGELNPNARFTDDEVIMLRERYINETTNEILKDYPDLSYSGLEKILTGVSYPHLPIYKKRQKKWIF